MNLEQIEAKIEKLKRDGKLSTYEHIALEKERQVLVVPTEWQLDTMVASDDVNRYIPAIIKAPPRP